MDLHEWILAFASSINPNLLHVVVTIHSVLYLTDPSLLGNIVLLTGPIDYISDGQRTIAIGNGHELLGQITGVSTKRTLHKSNTSQTSSTRTQFITSLTNFTKRKPFPPLYIQNRQAVLSEPSQPPSLPSTVQTNSSPSSPAYLCSRSRQKMRLRRNMFADLAASLQLC